MSTKILEPTRIRSLDDIRHVLSDLNPSQQAPKEVTISARLDDVENGKQVSYGVSAGTRSKTRREHLLEGMEMVKLRIAASEHVGAAVEVNGRLMEPPKLACDAGAVWVDPLIKQWLGGYRDGLMICWDLDGSHYTYDIFEHKLTRSNA